MSFSRLVLFLTTTLLAAADLHDALATVSPNFSPGPKYADGMRLFQGIPGLERARNGRLWAVWYAGGPDGTYGRTGQLCRDCHQQR